MSETESLSVIIPAYNEEAALEIFLPEIVSFCEERKYQLIVVDDGSKDKTQAVLQQFAQSPCLTIIRNKVNRGYGGAIKRGIAAADTDYVITLDSDGQHCPEDIDRLLAEIRGSDADMIVGQRPRQADASAYRSAGKALIRAIANILMPLNIHDLNSGMKIYATSLAKRYMDLCPNSMAFSDTITLMFINQRHLVSEVPISVRPRKHGSSTVNTMTAIETIKEIVNMVVLFNPMKIFFPLAMLLIVAATLWGLPILLQGRGLSVGALLGVLCGLIFLCFGLIAEQLSLLRKGNLSDS